MVKQWKCRKGQGEDMNKIEEIAAMLKQYDIKDLKNVRDLNDLKDFLAHKE